METWVALLGGLATLLGMGGIGGAVIAYRKVNILKHKTEAGLEQLKEQSFRDLIKDLTQQRQIEAKEHDDCEVEKEALREKYDKKIEQLKDEIDLRGTRILALKSIIVDKGIKIPDGL